MQDVQATQLNSAGWLLFVKISFVVSVLAMITGIVFVPTDLTIKGFFAMGTLYLIGSTFTLAKTIRDEFESQKLINKIADAKTEKILKEYDSNAA
ncbi:MAG: YiaA/YiaB family inner membrane protein [Acidiferrobacterales bacterium]